MPNDENVALAQLASDVLLRRWSEVLLLQRVDTGQWCLPGGRLDGNEKAIDGAIREAKEEVGVNIMKHNLEMVHIDHGMFRRWEMIAFYFVCDEWIWEPYNAEPDIASDMQWFDTKRLPSDMTMWQKKLITHNQHSPGITFDEYI